MKRSLVILMLNLLVCFSLAAQDKYPVNWDYKGETFQEFVARAESNLPVRFFFREEWVSGLRLGDYNGAGTLETVLSNLFRDNSLHFYIDDAGHVVVTKDFAVKRPGAVSEDPKMFIPTTFYIAGADEQQKSESVLIEIGDKVDRNRPGNVTVSGYITNSDTHEKVGGATISVPKISRGAISNEYGFYSLTLPRGTYEVKFSFVGMREKKINLNLFGSGELSVDLQATLIPLKETFISAERSATLQRFEAGAEKINISTFRLTPTSLGEPDLMKNILLISGVQSSGEGSAGFNVRGGSADQNLILLDGAPLYNTSHVFGFFSAINSDVIKDVTLYKGGIPGKYGGRISSVLDIQSLEGSPKNFTGSFGVSPLTTRLMISGPIKKDTLYYILAGRTTYSNWIFSKINNQDIKNSRASFYDLNGTMTWNTGRKDKYEITGYHSKDNSRFNTLADYGFVNTTGVAKWQHTYTTRFISTLAVNASYYSYKVTDREVEGEEYSREHRLNSTGLQADFNWFGGKHNISFGLISTKYSVLPGKWGPASESSMVTEHSIDRESALESAIYAEDKISITPVLSVNAGLRYSSFFSIGPHKIYLYDPAVPKSGISVYDTMYIGRGSAYGRYSGIEPRLSLNFRLSGTSSLKINYNRTRQYVHLLSNSMSVSPTDTWKLCDYYLKPQIGDQIAAGIYKFLNSRKFEASAEIYYKTIRNMLDYKGGTTLNFIENIEQETINMIGKSYGVELALKQSEGKFQYGISYTYARTFMRSNSNFNSEIINEGKWYPANCDKPNDLIVTMNYLYSRRVSFSAAYTYSTGRPITLPVGTYRIRDILVIQYSERNKYRIADYKRLDLSVKLSGNLKSKKLGHPNLTFSVYNVMGHYNTYSVYFRKENEVIKGYKLAIFGTQIPTVTFNYDF